MQTKNHNGGFGNIVLIISILIIGLVIGYVAGNLKNSDQIQVNQNEISQFETNVQCSQINWQASLPQIQNVLTAEFGQIVGQAFPVSIIEEVDLSGDGCTEVIVTTGNTGAYTAEYTILREENGNPIITELKEDSGQVVSVSIGSGASVRNQVGYKTLPQQNGFYTVQKNYDYQEQSNTPDLLEILADCDVNAYIWNSTTKLFEFDSNLAQSVAPTVCSD